jgi:hypothetical protein
MIDRSRDDVEEDPARDEHIAAVAVPAEGEPVCLNTRREHEQMIKRSIVFNYLFVVLILYPAVHLGVLAYFSFVQQHIEEFPILVGMAGVWCAVTLVPMIALIARGIRIEKCLVQLRRARHFVSNARVGADGPWFSYVTINGVRYSGEREFGIGKKRRLPWVGEFDPTVVYFAGESNEPCLIIQGGRFAKVSTLLLEFLPHASAGQLLLAMQNQPKYFGIFVGICFALLGAINILCCVAYASYRGVFAFYGVMFLAGIAICWASLKYFGEKGAIARGEISKEIAVIEARLPERTGAGLAKDLNALFRLYLVLGEKEKAESCKLRLQGNQSCPT